MALEDLTGTKYLDDLNSSNPAAGDNVSEGDDHIRGIKNVLKLTFPNVDAAVNATPTELNYVDGVTSAIQTQIDTKAPLASPTFTGTPVLPTSTTGVTQSADDNSTKLATTEYVDTADAIPASGTWVEIDTDTFAATSAHLDGMDNTLYSSYIIESHGVGRSGSGGTLYVQYKIGGVAQGQQTVGLITTSGSTHDRTEFFNDSSVNGSGGYFTITIGGVGTYSTANLASTVSGFYLYNNASGPFITGGYIRLLGLKK